MIAPASAAECIRRSGMVLEWDPASRLMRIAYEPGASPNALDALAMQAWLEARIGSGPFRAIADLRHADDESFAWRYRWFMWAYLRRDRIRAAAIVGPQIPRAAIRAFARGAGVPIDIVGSDAEARTWLLAAAEPI